MTTFRTSDGLTINYRVDDFTDPWASPETLVMLHSAMGRIERFDPMVPSLARHVRVVRMDLRGHGASAIPPPEEKLTMPRLVADVGELLDHLALPAAHFLGNSAGGYVCQNLALAHPQRVKSLCLFGSGTGLKGTDAANWVEKIGDEGLRPFFERTIAYRFAKDTDPSVVAWFLDEIARNSVPYLAKFVGLMTSLDWTDQLHRIGCPTLLVIPGDDMASKVRNYTPSLRRIPNITAVTYDGHRHNICDTVPDRCAADALAFLTTLA